MGTQEPRRYVRHNESQRERIITATAQLVKEWGGGRHAADELGA